MKEGYAINPDTGRIISKTTAKYKKLVKLGKIDENEQKEQKEPKQPKQVEIVKEKVVETVKEQDLEPAFNEAKLQSKLADISTSMIKDNLKKVVESQKLSDAELDTMLKRMLYKKLCVEENKPKKKEKKEKPVKKTKKKAKFKVVSSSESESESD